MWDSIHWPLDQCATWPLSYPDTYIFPTASLTHLLTKNGLGPRPRRARMTLYMISFLLSVSSTQINLKAPPSCPLIIICKRTCFRSPARSTGGSLSRHSTFVYAQCIFKIVVWSGGLMSKQSSREITFVVAIEDASQTVQTLVSAASALPADLCGR